MIESRQENGRTKTQEKETHNFKIKSVIRCFSYFKSITTDMNEKKKSRCTSYSQGIEYYQ